MPRPFCAPIAALLFYLAAVPAFLHAQESAAPADWEQRAQELEGQAAQSVDGSAEGAAILLELIDLYHANGQVYGLARHGRRFALGYPDHASHRAAMAKLLDGLYAASRHDDYIGAARQFLERYSGGDDTAAVARRLGRILERRGDRRGASAAFAKVWSALGAKALPEAEAAIWHAREIGDAEAMTAALPVAEGLMKQLPDGTAAAEVGLQGLQLARRLNDWERATAIGSEILRRNLPLKKSQAFDLQHAMAGQLQTLGRHGEAAAHYRKALEVRDDADARRGLVRSLADAGDPAGAEQEGGEFAKRYAGRDDRWEPLAWAAHAYHEAKNDGKARALLEALLPHWPHENSVRRPYYDWFCSGEKPDFARAESAFRNALAKADDGAAWPLQWALAIELYRDRMQDAAKAREQSRKALYELSPNEGGVRWMLGWLFESAPDQGAFEAEVKRFLAAARGNLHKREFWLALPAWAEEAQKNKDLRDRAIWAKGQWDAFKGSAPNFESWNALGSDNGGRVSEAREKLLAAGGLPAAVERRLLREHADGLRRSGNDKVRAKSLDFYTRLAALDPKDYGIARATLDAAVHDGTKEQAQAAAGRLLAIPAQDADTGAAKLLMRAAERAEDAGLAKRATEWIAAMDGKFGAEPDSAAEIGDLMEKLGLKAEALAFWRARLNGNDPDHYEVRNAAGRIIERLDDPGARIAFAQEQLKTVDDNHGAYAGWLADEHFKAGDYGKAIEAIRAARERQDQRPFRGWGLGDWPMLGWVETLRGSEEVAASDKARIYRAVIDADAGRASGSATAALLELGGEAAPQGIARLIAYADAAAISPPDNYSFDRLMPYAKAASARGDHAAAAALSAAVLGHLTEIDGGRRNDARTLLRTSFAQLGGVGGEVSPDSPIAPLLDIGLSLRLGDREAAIRTYEEHRSLFDQHLLDLPVEIIAFAANVHSAEGGEANFNRAEDILRAWMIKFSESDAVPAADKARIQIELAKTYHRAGRYEVARSEYATALNRYPDTPQAQDAKFGIGETYMEQKIYDQAEEIFGELAKSPQPATRLRAEFLRGVLAGRKGDRDDARLIFRDVLGSMPDVELADRALYQLAEIYGQEKRYLDQLELLRTVGRLSRQSKRWHDPGRALSIIVQDTDLGISRGNSRIPVSIKAEPGGDTEEIFLNSGGAGKGLFVGEIPTALGAAQPGDGVLQVLGADVIGVDYPDEFKKQFRFQVLSQNEIRIASDAEFDMASARIVKEGEETITDRINAEIAAEDSDPRKSAARPPSEVKPGNPIYFRVEDPDRSLSAEADEVSVKLAASSGDEVGAVLRETGPASGVFEGSVETGELPAGATATDSAIGRSPLMAIDNDPATSWLSEPDGVAPKAIAADMKEVREVAKIRISSPDAEKQAPKRMRLFGSHDGRFWYPLAAFPAPENPPAEVPGTDGAMKLRVFNTDNPRRTNWSEMVTMAKEAKPIDEAGEVEKLVWMPKPAAEGEKIEGNAAAMWTGKFVQPRDGAVRFVFSATAGAVMVDGAWVMPPTVAEGTGPLIADAFLKQGVHRLMIYAAAPREEGIAVERARENPNTPSVTVLPFQKEDFDLAAAQEAGLADAAAPEPAKVAHEGANWDFEIAPAPLRHVRAVVDEYSGEAVAISQIEISGAGGTYLPVEADLLALARNNVLEIAPGDTVTGTFIDLVGAEGAQRNRALTRTLSATYFNGQILPVGFDFLRAGGGSVTEIRKELLRIDPGERIVVEITDYDEDRTGGKDELAAEAEVGGQKVALTAVETGETTGVFRAELDTYDAAGAAPAEASEIPRIAVKRGDRLYLRYQDAENTFPGNAAFREAEVIVRTPTPGAMRIVESRAIPAAPDSEAPPQFAFLTQPPTGGAPKGVCYEVPLTIEVIDPDAAKDTRSRVMVELTGEGAPVTVACEISAAFSEAEEALAEERNPALRQGRFIGQVRLRLGGPGSPAMLPLGDDMPASTIGAVIQKSAEDAEIEPESGRGGRRQVMVPVLNVNGSTEIRARYADAERPGADAAVEIGDAARLLSEGALAITDPDYELDAGELAMGERLYLRVRDADLDVSDDRDRAMVHISVGNGEDETVELEEALGHSGVFTASFALEPNGQPTKGNLAAAGADAAIEGFFGQALKAAYLDQRPASQSEPLAHEAEVPIAVGTDGLLYAFSKVYGDEELAVQTQFHIAESYFELFKGHLRIGRDAEAQADLKAGRRTLRELAETFPSPKYAPRIEYLLGNFSQEMKDWDAAIASYRRITRDFPEHPLASDAQYKLGQCYEEADRLDEALESYVTLAATYPDSPLIANVMIRINERFYQAENYVIAAQVARKFLDRFESHEWAPRMGFRIGQCLYKGEQYAEAGDAFDEFVKRFPDDELTPQGLFWAGESYRMANNVPFAFRRYNRCRWDFPESDAAKYSRGRLALPEMLAQFEREANLEDE